MIMLTAHRIDVQGRYHFQIEANGEARATRDPVKAAKILSKLGVGSPSALVDHVREWGAVEIVEAAPAATVVGPPGLEPGTRRL